VTVAAFYMFRHARADGTHLGHVLGFGSDFRGTIWLPDRNILHGISPYPSPSHLPRLPSVYLPPIFLATLPLGLLPFHVAVWLWAGLLMAAGVATPAVLGVRDPWCYALWIPSYPLVAALPLGNASILLALLLALAWRFRDRALLGPIFVAASVALKTWLWPLLVWYVAVRRRSGLTAIGILAGVTLASWAAIRFDGLLDYSALMHAEGRAFVHGGVLLVALLVQFNVGVYIAAAAGLALGLAVLALAVGRRRDELGSFALAVLAALLATPVSWPHYVLLASVPIVAAWPYLSAPWAWFPLLWAAMLAVRPYDNPVKPSIVLTLFTVLATALVAARNQLHVGATRRHAPHTTQP
jgi:hypothetical protein